MLKEHRLNSVEIRQIEVCREDERSLNNARVSGNVRWKTADIAAEASS